MDHMHTTSKKHGPHCYTDNNNRLLYDRYNIVNDELVLLKRVHFAYTWYKTLRTEHMQ